NVKAMMGQAFTRMDLITREEFDVQAELLARARERVDQLDAQVRQLEARVAALEGGPSSQADACGPAALRVTIPARRAFRAAAVLAYWRFSIRNRHDSCHPCQPGPLWRRGAGCASRNAPGAGPAGLYRRGPARH